MSQLTNLLNIGGAKKRSEQRGGIRAQQRKVTGRIPGIEAYFDSLLGRVEERAELDESNILSRFIDESHSFRRGSEEAQARTGFAEAGGLVGQQERGLQSMFRDVGFERDTLTANLEDQRLQIGQQRIGELQGIEDLLFQLETARQGVVPT